MKQKIFGFHQDEEFRWVADLECGHTQHSASRFALAFARDWSANRMSIINAMDHEGFGSCTMHRECEAVCPKEISVNFIAGMNREYLVTSLRD